MKLVKTPRRLPLPSPLSSGVYQTLPVRALYLSFLDPIPKNLKVLDVGCGSGFVLRTLEKLNCEVYGIDQSDLVIKSLRREGLPVKTYCLGSFGEFDGSSFDLILCFDVLEHVPAKERVLFLEELFSWKGTNNFLFFSLPYYRNHGNAPEMEELKPFLDSFQYSIFQISYPVWFHLYQKLKQTLRWILRVRESDRFEENFGFRNLSGTPMGFLLSHLQKSAMLFFRLFPLRIIPSDGMEREGTYLLLVRGKTL